MTSSYGFFQSVLQEDLLDYCH